MTGIANRALEGHEQTLRVLVAATVLQTWTLCASLCGIVLLVAASQSSTLRGYLDVVTALANACVRIALQLLMS